MDDRRAVFEYRALVAALATKSADAEARSHGPAGGWRAIGGTMIRSLLIFLFFTSCAPVRNGSRLEAVNPVPVPGPSISFVKRFKGHDDTLYRLAVSPTNRDLAISMDQDGHAVLWNLALGTKYWDTLLKLHKHLHAVAFSHDGHWIVAGGRSGVLKILSVETGQVVREFSHPDQIKPLYFRARSVIA